MLQKAAVAVQGHFSQFPDFSPRSVLIVTWDNVVPYEGDRSIVSIDVMLMKYMYAMLTE